MMRYGVSFALSEIFFTHFHADHFLGVIGLIRTLGLQGRPEPLFLYGPKGAKKVLGTAMQLGVERVPFPVEITEVKAGDTVGREGGRGKRDGYEVCAFPTEHGGGPSIGYVLKEHVRRGRFDVEKAKAAGIPEGPMWGQLAKGEPIELADGRKLAADGFSNIQITLRDGIFEAAATKDGRAAELAIEAQSGTVLQARGDDDDDD